MVSPERFGTISSNAKVRETVLKPSSESHSVVKTHKKLEDEQSKPKDLFGSFLHMYKEKNQTNDKHKNSLQKSIQMKIDKLSKPRTILRRNFLSGLEEKLDENYRTSRRHSQQSQKEFCTRLSQPKSPLRNTETSHRPMNENSQLSIRETDRTKQQSELVRGASPLENPCARS